MRSEVRAWELFLKAPFPCDKKMNKKTIKNTLRINVHLHFAEKAVLKKVLANFFLVFGFLLSTAAFSATQTNNKASLSDLEAFVSKYPNVQKLLDDSDGLSQYRELLKAYMGYKSDEFDPVFKKTIEQMHSLVKEVPNFAEQIWKNQASGEAVINIQASSVARSGIETKLTVLEERLAEQRKIYEKEAQDILKLTADEQTKKAQELADTARVQLAKIEARYPDDIKNPSRSKLTSAGKGSELAQARQKLAQERKDFFQNNPQLRALVSFIKYKLMTKESWLDRYRSPFAEDSLQALEDMRKLENIDAELGELKVDPLIRANIKYLPKDELHELQASEFEAAKDIKKQINKIQEPTLDPKIVYQQKKQAWQSLQGAYQIEVVDLPEQGKFSLRDQNSKDIALRPTRAFHAAFTGHYTRECVGGAGCESLTPRRWALSALNGVRTYMAEKGGTFDGALRLIRVESPVGSGKYYDDVDAMLKSIDASSEIKSQVTGQTAKYPMFDSILDHLKPSEGSLGFIAGDGRAISQNTGLAAVYEKSPSVIASENIEKISISPIDHQMEKAINEIFTDRAFGYNPGGMVYEAMANDGSTIYLLKPRKDRKKYTKAELEEMLFNEVLNSLNQSSQIDISQNPAWSLAVENDIKLKDHSYYLNLKNIDRETLMEFIKACEKTNALKGLSNLAEYGHEALKAHPETLMEFIKACEKTNALKGLSNLAEYGHEALKAHPEALMEFIKVSEKTNALNALANLAEYGHEALKAHPEAMAAFKDAFPRAIRAAGDRGDLNALANLANQHEVFENHPEAKAAFKDAFPRAIRAAGDRGDFDALANLARYGYEALKAHPEAMSAFKDALPRAIRAAGDRRNLYALVDLARYGYEALKAHPEAMSAFKDALPRAIRAAGDRGDLNALNTLAEYGHEALKDHPEALMEFIKACEKTNAIYALRDLARHGHEALKAHPEALMEFIKACEKTNALGALSNLAKYGHEALNAHPEALLALLETLARNPQLQEYDYREAVQNTNKFLEKEFNNNEKLSELFLSSKNGKEVLSLLAKNKNFPTINNWLARTKEALPAETLSLIQDTDAHQREARKSLATSSNASNSGNSVDKCLRFLRLVFLKYSGR
jgi:hypothetical protein